MSKAASFVVFMREFGMLTAVVAHKTVPNIVGDLLESARGSLLTFESLFDVIMATLYRAHRQSRFRTTSAGGF